MISQSNKEESKAVFCQSSVSRSVSEQVSDDRENEENDIKEINVKNTLRIEDNIDLD